MPHSTFLGEDSDDDAADAQQTVQSFLCMLGWGHQNIGGWGVLSREIVAIRSGVRTLSLVA